MNNYIYFSYHCTFAFFDVCFDVANSFVWSSEASLAQGTGVRLFFGVTASVSSKMIFSRESSRAIITTWIRAYKLWLILNDVTKARCRKTENRTRGRHKWKFFRYPVPIGTQNLFSGCYPVAFGTHNFLFARYPVPMLHGPCRNKSEDLYLKAITLKYWTL